MKGFFLTFEGIEGCGKSTQVKLLKNHLIQQGYDVLITREPGDGEMGSRIRELLLSVTSTLDPLTELFLLAADRTRHVVEIVEPALRAGKVVISDRYTDSSMAYQGYGRGLDTGFVRTINEKATHNVFPDLTLVLDMSPEVSILRSQQRLRQQDMFEAEGRFEQESLDFHSRVRQGYLKIAEAEPRRVTVIDATDTIDHLFEKITRIICNRLQRWKDGDHQ